LLPCPKSKTASFSFLEICASVREYFSPSQSGLFFQFHPEIEKDNKDPANPVNPVCSACPMESVFIFYSIEVEYEIHSSGVAPEDGTGV